MLHIKIFQVDHNNYKLVENNINSWIKTNKEKVYIINVKYTKNYIVIEWELKNEKHK